MTGREILIGAALMVFMFWIGVYPAPLIHASNQAALSLIKVFEGAPEVMMALVR
jgi:NADH:ubiquinone oxidoreductase subunit 4 (subunit M)